MEFTLEQLERLSEILWDYQDEGPIDEGWASEEVIKLRDLVDNKIAKLKKELKP